MNLFEFAPTCRLHYSLANHFNGFSTLILVSRAFSVARSRMAVKCPPAPHSNRGVDQ
jgi:hypothetical protein